MFSRVLTGRQTPAVLALVLVATAAGFAVWSFTLWAESTPATMDEAPTPTPGVVSGAPGIEAARASLVAQHPEIAGLVPAVETAEVDAVLPFLKWVSFSCDQLMYRDVDECARQGISKGTQLDLFAMEGFEGAFQREDVRESIGYDLAGRHPRFALAVEREDRSLVLVFLLDPKPDLVFPGGEPAGGAEEIAVVFGTTAEDPSQITVYDHKFQGSPPLEFLRYEEHQGVKHTVLGVSPELQALEDEWHQEDERNRAR